MQLSTVKRERLIPPVYLISIALLLTVAFIVLLPSREAFTIGAPATIEPGAGDIDDLDVAYIRASDAAGKLSSSEMSQIIGSLIRSSRWSDARALMAERPDVRINPNDSFLLELETAHGGYVNADNQANEASYAADLINILTDFLDNKTLHDTVTLVRAAQISDKLKQPELSASYRLVLASADPDNAVKHLQDCATTLAAYHFHGQAETCYRTAIARATDPVQKAELNVRLINLLSNSGDQFAASNELESLVSNAPREKTIMPRIATIALATERPDLAYPLYAQLSEIDNERSIFWLEKAVKWSEASNMPGLSAEYLASIIEISDAKYHPELIKRRQALLIAAGRNEEALQTIHTRLIASPNDAELLLEGIKMATGMGLPAQAMQWNEQILAIRPFDIDSMQRQIDFSLATKQLASALQWSRKIIEIEPNDRASRIKLAQLEEWNGNVPQAQQQRQWLAAKYPSQANDVELLRVSELNWDSATAAKTLQRIAKRQPLSYESIIKLVALHEADGRPDLAAQALIELQNGGTMDAMLIRELATLTRRYKDWPQSLTAWQTFAARFGRSSEESINRMELHWRLREPEKALEMASNVSARYLANATLYQLELMSNLGWRYRKPDLVLASAPYLARREISEDKRVILNQRLVQSHLDSGNTRSAIAQAERIWRATNDNDFLLSALRITLEQEVYPDLERYLDANGELLPLRDMPDYWLLVAAHYNKKSDTLAALETYESTLMMQPDNVNAKAGILWTLVGDEYFDAKRLTDTLSKYQTAAIEEPELWSPFAIAHLKLNDPKASLRWFSKIMLKDDHDYNILLSFADALEQSGDNPHAFKVRQYALNKLRPLALAQAEGETNAIARDYIGLLQTYGSSGENEAWAQRLLAEAENTTGTESVWRQEMAASWYLSTQRNDYARLILTKMHEQRLATPTWQQLALALADDDTGSIQEILASGKPLSPNDRIQALRQVGKERQAYELARDTMTNSESAGDRERAAQQVIAMRAYRPGYAAGRVNRHAIGDLNITETGLSLRHTLASADIGFSVNYNRRQLELAEVDVQSAIEDDLEISAHFGNSMRGGSLTAGTNSRSDGELNYTSGQLYVRDRVGKSALSTEVYINEVADGNENQRIAARQDRAELSYSHTIGSNQYVKVSGAMSEVKSRDTDLTVSKNVGASIELGTNGTIGSNSWSMGVIATQNNTKDNGVLQTAANGDSQFIAAPRDTNAPELALNAALFRGGVQSEYPSAASPRYHVNAQLGHNMNSDTTAFNVSAGAGFRLLGNDELSFKLEHKLNYFDSLQIDSDSNIGIEYRNHF